MNSAVCIRRLVRLGGQVSTGLTSREVMSHFHYTTPFDVTAFALALLPSGTMAAGRAQP